MTESTYKNHQQRFFAMKGDFDAVDTSAEVIAAFYKHLEQGKGTCTTLQDIHGCLVVLSFLGINAEGVGANHQMADIHAFQVWWLKAIRLFGLPKGGMH